MALSIAVGGRKKCESVVSLKELRYHCRRSSAVLPSFAGNVGGSSHAFRAFFRESSFLLLCFVSSSSFDAVIVRAEKIYASSDLALGHQFWVVNYSTPTYNYFL
jgi:hypothetical protein